MMLIKALLNKHRQLFLYGIIGASGAFLDLICFLLLFNVFNLSPIIATALSTSVGIVNNFILNTRFNFKVKDKLHHRFAIFYLVGFLGLMLSVAIIYLLHDLGNMNANIAKIVSIPLVVVTQYIINSRISFSSSLDNFIIRGRNFIKTSGFDTLLLSTTLIIFCLSSYYAITTDDVDNLLGGKLILSGELPYRDFFTHHMPGMYFLSALIYPFTHGNAFIYRLFFNIILFFLLFTIYKLMSRKVSLTSARVFVILTALSHTIALNHIPVAESVIVYILGLSLLLIIYEKGLFSLRKIAVLSFLIFLIPFLALSYLFVSVVLYIMLTWQIIRSSEALEGTNKRRYYLTYVGIVAIPYVIFLLYLILSSSVEPFMFNNLKFNSLYYGPMVGEEGGTPLKVLWNIITGSLGRIATLTQNFLNPAYTIQLLLLGGYGLFAGLLWVQKKRLISLAILLLPLFLDARVNIFNTSAITGNLENYALGAIIYLGTALLCASIAIPPLFNRRKNTHDPLILFAFLLSLVYLIIIPVNLFRISAPKLATVSSGDTERNYYLFTENYAAHSPSLLINELLNKNDYAWVGPDGFRDNLYLKPQRASKFTFFFAWIYQCEECRTNFLSDLEKQEPKIIYWSGFEYSGKPYYQEIKAYMDKHYFKATDPRLEKYYFLNSDKTNLTRKLIEHGYKV